MFSKKSQSSPITVIVSAVIGLIVLVVIIAMLTGKLGDFGKGLENANTCSNACKAIGADDYNSLLPVNCKDDDDYKKEVLNGDFSDITLENNVCCCYWKK